MSLFPLNELKRRLEDCTTPLPKRLCLAKNVVQSRYFPKTPKERIVSEWLADLTDKNILGHDDFQNVLGWLSFVKEPTNELMSHLIMITFQHIKETIKPDDVVTILNYIEDEKFLYLLDSHMKYIIAILKTILKYLNQNDMNLSLKKRVFGNLIRYLKETKRKFEFIVNIIDNIDIIFDYVNDLNLRDSVIQLSQIILFPTSKKSLYTNYLQMLIKNDSPNKLMEKGDSVRSVIKIMDLFFNLQNPDHIQKFIDLLVNCFKDSQIIFYFYITIINYLKINQNYINITINCIEIDEKIKRKLFLSMIQCLIDNEIDLNVKLSTHSKNFLTLIQISMMGVLKLHGKVDLNTLSIITAALKLDPILIEQKINNILPFVMVAKKNNDLYTEMMDCLLEILFKLSRGTVFLNQILPHIRRQLEINLSTVSSEDLFPRKCIDKYGRLMADLTFRQNSELFSSLQKDFEECLLVIEERLLSPSIICLTDVMVSVLCSYLEHSKMADHTVPLYIAKEFWDKYQNFENILKRFGEFILNDNNRQLRLSFLKLCLSCLKLKLLNYKYGHTKIEMTVPERNPAVSDISMILPCLTGEQWTDIYVELEENEMETWNNILLLKIAASEILLIKDHNKILKNIINETKKYLIDSKSILNENYYTIFKDLDPKSLRELSKTLVKNFSETPTNVKLQNKQLINAVIMEINKLLIKLIENDELEIKLSKSLTKHNFDIINFTSNISIIEYFDKFSTTTNIEHINNLLNILKDFPLHDLNENCKLTTIFVLILIKHTMNNKKINKIIDNLLFSIFELSTKCPDLYKIYPIDFIFDENDLLLKLTSKTNYIVKSLLALAVKSVKTDKNIIVNVVNKLLSVWKIEKQSGYSYDKTFQLICFLLPVISKERKSITQSTYRKILVELQEKLHKNLLKSLKNITENTDSAFNAIDAYTLILAKCCESNDNDLKNLDCLWTSLEYFVENSINAIQCKQSEHVDASIQLIITILRYIRKLESHKLFENKGKIFTKIWQGLKKRISYIYVENFELNSRDFFEEITTALKFLFELSSVEWFVANVVSDLNNIMVIKKFSSDVSDMIISHKVSYYIWQVCMKTNIVGQKCASLGKIMHRSCKQLTQWLQSQFKKKINLDDINHERNIKINDVCNVVKIYMDTLAEVILAGKRISFNDKFMDAIFEFQHAVLLIIGQNVSNSDISWDSFQITFEGVVNILNCLLISRGELLEDRWPCFLQCYRPLLSCLCKRSSSQIKMDLNTEKKMADIAHSVEKLTQAICKRKSQISRLAAYLVADLCVWMEQSAPIHVVRQHLENSVALLIQASDSTYAMAFLRRALAGAPGHMTLTNMYTMYKRYHKYVGIS